MTKNWAIIGISGFSAIIAIVSWSLARLNSSECFSSLSPHGNLCFDLVFIFSIFVFIFVEALVLIIINKKNIFESWVKFTFNYLIIYLIIYYIVPAECDAYLVICKQTVWLFLTPLYVVLSIIFIAYKSIKKNS